MSNRFRYWTLFLIVMVSTTNGALDLFLHLLERLDAYTPPMLLAALGIVGTPSMVVLSYVCTRSFLEDFTDTTPETTQTAA